MAVDLSETRILADLTLEAFSIFKQFQQECGHFAGEVLSLATLSAREMSA
jgi:hypothetical protein